MLVVLAGIAGLAGQNSMILRWSYVSMGLRASGTLIPLVTAVLAPGRLSPAWALAAGSAGLLVTLAWHLTGLAPDPLAAGLTASALTALSGMIAGRGRRPLGP